MNALDGLVGGVFLGRAVSGLNDLRCIELRPLPRGSRRQAEINEPEPAVL